MGGDGLVMFWHRYTDYEGCGKLRHRVLFLLASIFVLGTTGLGMEDAARMRLLSSGWIKARRRCNTSGMLRTLYGKME